MRATIPEPKACQKLLGVNLAEFEPDLESLRVEEETVTSPVCTWWSWCVAQAITTI